MQLKGSKTEENLRAAFASEAEANRRYLYFANKADIEGQSDISALFRSTAEGETGHAHGHLDYLAEVGDPTTGLPIGSSRDNPDELAAQRFVVQPQDHPPVLFEQGPRLAKRPLANGSGQPQGAKRIVVLIETRPPQAGARAVERLSPSAWKRCVSP